MKKLKLKFIKTPHGTIRLFMTFNKKDIQEVKESNEYKLFELLSIWDGYDKAENEMFSWEFDMSLLEYFKNHFDVFHSSKYEECDIIGLF